MHLRIGGFSRALAALCCSTTLLACLSVDFKTGSSKPADKPTVLRGVVSSASGEPLANVKATTGDAATVTDSKGRYELKAPIGEDLVHFELDGYIDGFRSPTLIKDNPTQLDVSLLPRAESAPLDAADGGRISGEFGAAVQVPENVFLANGKAVTGTVDVYLSPFDPNSQDDRAAAPELVAEVSGDLRLLESLGMIDIQVRQDDEPLAIATGKTIELSIPVVDGSEPDDSIDLWSFDETKSVWVDEGKATYDSQTNTYVATAKHLALWNAARVLSATCICGIVQDGSKHGIAAARVEAVGMSYFGLSSAQTGADGRFCIPVGKNADVDVTAYDANSGGESKEIHTKSQDTFIPPRSSDARCQDVGTWMVTKDVSP